MQCSYCGAGIAENELFCGECGAPRPELPRPPEPVQRLAVEIPARPDQTPAQKTPAEVIEKPPATYQGKSPRKSRRSWIWALLVLVLVCLCCVSLLAFENPLRNWIILWMVEQGWGHIEGSAGPSEMAPHGLFGFLVAGFQDAQETRQAWFNSLLHRH